LTVLHRADLETLWLLGRPVSHSLSPLIQNTALRKLGLPVIYLAACVEDQSLEAAVRGLASLGALGANVTVPHKEAAFRLCDSLSARARAMGACNVLKFAGGKVFGDNTDGAGWLRGIVEVGELPRRALVIGAGGAARAIVHSLVCRRVPEIVVLNRTLERAQALVSSFSAQQHTRFKAASNEDFLLHLEPECLVVQTTSAGLDEASSPLPVLRSWPDRAILSELIYGRETPLSSQVKKLGGVVHDGLPMLVYQAAESLSIWLDRPLAEIPAQLMLDTARQHLSTLS
jgi:shikimate dehydrogenase